MVLVFGTVCIDRVRRIEKLPKPGGYAEIIDQQDFLGGEAANTASFLVMWRSEAVLVSNSIGSGYEGERLRFLVLEKGLSDVFVPRFGTTPVCDVYVSADGDRTMYGSGFSTMAPLLDIHLLPFEKGEWFTAEPNMQAVSRQVAHLAHQKGMKLYLMDFYRDDEWIPPGTICQYSTDWVGERGNCELNLKWADQWSARHRCTTILTDAGNSLVVSQPGGGAVLLPVFPAEAVIDTTGAGDAFRAGTLHGLDNDWSLSKCLQFGSCAGSMKVASFGATEGIPSKREVLDRIDQHPEIVDTYNRLLGK